MNNVCSQLDAYLTGELHSREVAVFEAHLRACAECRLHISIDRGLDTKIVEAWQHVRGPKLGPGIVHRVKTRRVNQLTSWPIAMWSTVAASVLILGFCLPWLVRLGSSESVQNNKTPVPRPSKIEAEQSAPQVFVASKQDGLLLVPTTRSSPNFTIVKVYRPIIPIHPIERISNEPKN